MFSTSNSGRKIVTSSPRWKSRSLDLGNRHRTSLNFGDLVPAYWQHVAPGDKLRLDASVLAKFMPLIAPAFSRMKIKSEWFYVPLRQISPVACRALQDFQVEPLQISDYFNQLLTGFIPTESKRSSDQQVGSMAGFPCIPSWVLSYWLCNETVTRFFGSDSLPNDERYLILGSDTPVSNWRQSGQVNSSADFSKLGYENLTTFSSKRRVSRFLSYLGLPSRLTQMRYTSDVLLADGTFNYDLLSGTFPDDDDFKHCRTFYGNSDVWVDCSPYPSGFSHFPFISDRYRYLAFASDASMLIGVRIKKSDGSVSGYSEDIEGLYPYTFATDFPTYFTQTSSNFVASSSFRDMIVEDFGYFPIAACNNHQLISLLPAQAYQKIYNDFYRDEILQKDEVRLYPNCYINNDFSGLNWSDSGIPDGQTPWGSYVSWSSPKLFVNNVAGINGGSSSLSVFINNLFMLRRRNRAKDVLSSSVTSRVVFGQRNSQYNDATVTVYDANLSSKLAKFFMKKEFTGSTWAEWLNNFFGVNSNDLLNNNVVYLGGKESVVGISENIQQSSSTDDSAQGNRAGLAADFHSGSEIYFRVPDFGIVMCIVSVIPDDLDNFNGLQERFVRQSVFDFNLPDFQNLGFSPVFNQRSNIGFASVSADFTPPSGVFPSGSTSQNYGDSPVNPQGVFGYQPFGYAHTYTPNVISCDLQDSLRYWHQSPDLDFDFRTYAEQYPGHSYPEGYASWADSQLSLNANLPAIGLRQLPLGAKLAAQYYNNVFAVTNDESGDHIVADMRFSVTCHRNTAFFTDAVGCDE